MHDVEEVRRNVLRLCRGFLLSFAALSLVLAYWHVYRAPALRADPLNPRAQERLKLTQPGRVITADGLAVLESAKSNSEWYFDYPGHEVFCHLTGYDSKTGLQPALRDALYATGPYEDPWVSLLGGRPIGCDITLTISGRAQAVATELMRDYRGAVVALDPWTGAVRVLASAPAYDPAGVVSSPEDYKLFRSLPDKPELNRALLGLYPPGSVLKILTAAAALDRGTVRPESEFLCTGQAEVAHSRVHCRLSAGHGRLTLRRAFTDSCNVVFAQVGQSLGPAVFQQYVERFHLLQQAELPLPSKRGRMAKMDGPRAESEVVEAAFGQGATLVSPAAIARLAATIATGGQVPQLQLIQRITRPDGKVLFQLAPAVIGQAVPPQVAKVVAGMMVDTVEKGTGIAARIRGTRVAGKTGSAQNPQGPPHAWFAGFAPADDPRIAIAVVVENGGAGGEVAAPIARQVMTVLLAQDRQGHGL